MKLFNDNDTEKNGTTENKVTLLQRLKRNKLRLAEIPQEISAEEKRDIRIKKRRMRRIRSIVVLIVVVVALLTTGVLLFLDKNGYADIETIDISGNSRYSVNDIITISKVKVGDGLISLNSSAVKTRLLALPYVEGVKISKRPLHTLKIVLTEKIPEIAVYFGGKFATLDAESLLLEFVNSAGELPIIEGFQPKTAKLGKTFVPEDETHYQQAVEIVRLLKEESVAFIKVMYDDNQMKIFITENFVCQGSYKNIINNIAGIDEVIKYLAENSIERATVYFGDDGYTSFSPIIE